MFPPLDAATPPGVAFSYNLVQSSSLGCGSVTKGVRDEAGVCETVKVVIVHNVSMSEEDVLAISPTVEGVAPEDLRLVHIPVREGQTGISDLVETAVMNDEEVVAVLVVTEEEGGPVLEWVEETTLGFWDDLAVNMQRTDGQFVGFLGDESEDLTD